MRGFLIRAKCALRKGSKMNSGGRKMKRKLKSALSLLLCMIMVFGALAVGGEGIGELKASAASVTCHYYGSTWRVTIPANTFLQFYKSTALTTKYVHIKAKSDAYDLYCYNAYYMSDGTTVYSFVDSAGRTCYFPYKSSYSEYTIPSSNSSISDSDYSLKNGCYHYKRFSWNSTGASKYTVKLVDYDGYTKINDSVTNTSYDVLHESHSRGNIYSVGINGRGDPLYYTFYVIPDNSGEIKTYTFSFTGIINANTHCAEYDANGGSGAPSSQYLECERYFNISSTTPSRPGYTFLGWSTSPNASSASYQPGDSVYCDAQSYKFYAVWRNDTSYYSVYYDANGGSGAPSRQTKASTHNLTLSSVKPTKSFSITYNANGGYTASSGKTVSCSFKSWNTAVNGNRTTYYPGGTYINNADVTLYAQWINPTVGALPTPTRDGYTFDGWYTGKDSGSKITESSTVSRSLTLYAHWNKITYNLSYNANGGIGTPATQSGSTSYTISSTIPTRSGYTFLGWSKSSSATTPEFRAGNTITLTGNTTLYAVWVNIYNLGEETYSFRNYGDSHGDGHCFGMAVTSSGYYTGKLNKSIIGGNSNYALYSFSNSSIVKEPICHYFLIQGPTERKSMVAGGNIDLQNKTDINADWNACVNFVKNHKYDNKGVLNVGMWFKGGGGHAVNFLYYKEVNGQQRIYVYDNNFPEIETYYYIGSDGYVHQAPKQTTNKPIIGIDLMDTNKYFTLARSFDAKHYIYANKNEITVEGAKMYYMKCGPESSSYVMYEIPENATEVSVTPLVKNASFEYIDNSYSFEEVNSKTYGILTIPSKAIAGQKAEFEIFDTPAKISISSPSVTTISYGFTLNLHANVTDLPEGARVVWSMDGGGFELIPSADGMTCGVKSVSKGSATITARVVDKNGNTVKGSNDNDVTASQQLTSKAGFFQKLAAFFKKLFGSNMVIPYALEWIVK